MISVVLSAEKLFTRIKRAKEVLLDENMRTKYDEWRGGVFKSYWSFDDWLALQSRVHTVSTSTL